MDFSIVKKAGLRQQEFAKLCGVSRVAANMWINGKTTPHKMLAMIVAKRLDLLQEAVTLGDLPISPNVKRTERERELFAVITQVAQRRNQRAEVTTD